jgi:formiminotetrahydrofolate cyclodeaminase
VPEEELIRTAALSLGLSDVVPFDPKKKIIEYQFVEPAGPLVRRSVREFANELSTESPAPGGGSVAALCGALSAGLSSMVANLTVGKKGYEAASRLMVQTAVRAQDLKDECLRLVDEDTAAFNAVMDAFRLPKATDAQKAERDAAVESATKRATLVPFRLLELSEELVKLAGTAARRGNKNSRSDSGVAALTARTAADGAYYNVRINLPGLKDESFRAETAGAAIELQRRVGRLAASVERLIERELRKT